VLLVCQSLQDLKAAELRKLLIGNDDWRKRTGFAKPSTYHDMYLSAVLENFVFVRT